MHADQRNDAARMALFSGLAAAAPFDDQVLDLSELLMGFEVDQRGGGGNRIAVLRRRPRSIHRG
jgi:hypothetical protein